MLIPRSSSFICQELLYIEHPYDMVHVDLFNSIYQMSNNDKMTPKDTDLTLFLDDK